MKAYGGFTAGGFFFFFISLLFPFLLAGTSFAVGSRGGIDVFRLVLGFSYIWFGLFPSLLAARCVGICLADGHMLRLFSIVFFCSILRGDKVGCFA